MKYSKYLVLTTPISQFLLFELLLWRPKLFHYIFFLTFSLALATMMVLKKESGFSRSANNYFPLPIFFSSGILVYLTIANTGLNQILIFTNLFFSFFLFKNIFYLFFNKQNEDRLKNILSFGNLLAVFFISSGLLGAKYFLSLPVWFLVVLNLPVMMIIVWSVLGVNRIDKRDSLIFILIGAFVFTEILWVISFLPFNHNTLGLIFTICYYIYIGIVRFFLSSKGVIRAKTINIYLAFGFISLLLIILSSKA